MKVTKDEKKEYDRLRYLEKREQLLKASSEYAKANPEVGRRKAQKHREKVGKIAKKNDYLQLTYNLSWKTFLEMHAVQGGKCKICSVEILPINTGRGNKTANVDHCHTTGRIRGLLCNSCNRALGLLKEDSEILRKAARYLDACN